MSLGRMRLCSVLAPIFARQESELVLMRFGAARLPNWSCRVPSRSAGSRPAPARHRAAHPLTEQTCLDADFCAGFGERNVSSQKTAIMHDGHRHLQGIQGLERKYESCEPLARLRKMCTVHRKAGVNSLLQMGLKDREDAMRVRPAHFAGVHFAGQCENQFQFHKRASRAFALFGQYTLRPLAQGFRAVIGGQYASVDINQ